jgi:DNA-binding NarL/FixJ family response regulator
MKISRPIVKTVIKIAIVTALVMLLFQIASLLFIYKYFKFDYYLTAAALFFLASGYIISKYKHSDGNKLPTGADPISTLTQKELYILQLIIAGKSNKEIAAINFVEISTIKTHINNIYSKLGLSNRKQAILRYKTMQNDANNIKIHPFSTQNSLV